MKWNSSQKVSRFFEIMSPKGGASTATSGGDFSCISPGGREELVGKRFLLVASSSGKSSKSPPKLSRISEWNWKAGVIRCASHVDSRDPELQVRYISLFFCLFDFKFFIYIF